MRAADLTRRLLLAATATLGVASLAACDRAGAAASGQDMSLGKANAPVTVEEYASLTCGHCAAFNEQVFPELKRKYVDTGQVRYVLKEFLTPPNEVAAAGFLVARCAGPDKYFQVVDAVFKNQGEMLSGGGANVRPTLLRIAQSAGMTEQRFQQCVSDTAQLEALGKRVNAGVKSGIDSTPTFLVNGKKVEGAPTMATLDRAIAAAKK